MVFLVFRSHTRPHSFPPLALVLALSFSWSCSGRRSQEGPLIRDSAGVTIVENAVPRWAPGEEWTLAPGPYLDIGNIDGNPEYQFFRIQGAVRMSDGRLAIANGGSSEIRFFDGSGVFLHAVGGKGSGPGEFEDLFFLEGMTGDSLLAYDWRNRRVSILAPDGEFIRSYQFTVLTTVGGFPVVAKPFPDRDLLLVADMFSTSPEPVLGTKRDSAIFYVIGPDGEVVESLGAFPGGESYQTTDGENWVGGGLAFGKSGYAAVSEGGFFYGSSDRFEIDYRNKKGTLLRSIRLDHENLPVTQGDIDRYIAERLERARPERRQIHETMYENMPFPDFMPAHGDFRVDADGSLWVSEYRKPGDDQPRWKIFAREGVYLGVVETPPGFSIFEIGADYILGSWRDDLDVEHVQVYELRRG